MEGQVLQRNNNNKGKTIIKGMCKGPGIVEILVKNTKNKTRWKKTGTATAASFEANVNNIPAGGPYSLEIRVVSQENKIIDKTTIKEFYVGDVWFLGGQSNMQGIGNLSSAPKPHPMVRAFYMRDEWDIAKEPLHIPVSYTHLTLPTIYSV